MADYSCTIGVCIYGADIWQTVHLNDRSLTATCISAASEMVLTNESEASRSDAHHATPTHVVAAVAMLQWHIVVRLSDVSCAQEQCHNRLLCFTSPSSVDCSFTTHRNRLTACYSAPRQIFGWAKSAAHASDNVIFDTIRK